MGVFISSCFNTKIAASEVEEHRGNTSMGRYRALTSGIDYENSKAFQFLLTYRI